MFDLWQKERQFRAKGGGMCFQRLLGKYKFENPQVAVESKEQHQLWRVVAEKFRATGVFLENSFRSEWQISPRFGGLMKKMI